MSDVLVIVAPLLVVIVVAWFCFDRQAAIYAQMVVLLERERDEAKQEARVFRGLLFPAIAKAESLSLGGNSEKDRARPKSSVRAMPARAEGTDPKPQSFYRPSRIPFRLRFNRARKQTNTPQKKTDALASALASVANNFPGE